MLHAAGSFEPGEPPRYRFIVLGYEVCKETYMWVYKIPRTTMHRILQQVSQSALRYVQHTQQHAHHTHTTHTAHTQHAHTASTHSTHIQHAHAHTTHAAGSTSSGRNVQSWGATKSATGLRKPRWPSRGSNRGSYYGLNSSPTWKTAQWKKR
jgi:hypothetical protein